ncbi:peptidase [Nitrosopumilus sp.]|uniref:peptidase n=1 Tax=Nitrosopumilus sp. TaxID=2024843 RepID=UPI00247B30F3|nr:peptidase [Nitrosopumilus sp.]MCV0430918.1 peptidase [Nitrosopumilus sp.]
MKILFALTICIFFAIGLVPDAFSHGLGGEVLPPVTINGKDATLSIGISPSVYDENNSETNISLKLYDTDSSAIIEHVTFDFELKKEGKLLFKDIFHDELGNLNIKVLTDNSDKTTIEGSKEPLSGGWIKKDFEPIVIRGPVFTSGGLYDYTVKILTINSDSNVLSEEIILEGAISLAENNFFDVKSNSNEDYTLQLISYFDKINNFSFDSNTIKFSMPFDWNQNIEQLSVVHEEIRVPNTFGDFLSTTYTSIVNDIALPADAVTIDDYSFEDRTIHLVLNQKLIKEIRDSAILDSDNTMNFELKPNQQVTFPLEFATPDLRYKVFLSWEPEIIHTSEEVKFFVSFEELFSDRSQKLIEYDLTIIQKGSEIYSKHLVGNANSINPNIHKIIFDDAKSGTANFVLSNINGHSLSKGNFIIVIQPSNQIQSDIPSWIKNNAGWWSDGTIDDTSFIQGIQFLIKEKILQVPITTQNSESNSSDIPSWIKNNAGWWSDGTIDDTSFIQGIQYLIKEGIVQIEN